MMRARAPIASRRLAGLAVAAAGLLGCQAVLGIQDVTLDPGPGEGGAGTGAGGAGGQDTQGDFAFAIRPAEVRIPYDGITHVDVEITRVGGFDAPIEVSVLGAPAGLVTTPITVPGGATGGQLQVGASGPLVIGTELELTLLAVAGDLTRQDSVPAIVTDRPGSLDGGFGSGGITVWDLAEASGGLFDVREVAGGKVLVTGNSVGDSGRSRFEVARLLATGGPDTGFNGTGFQEASYCDCGQLQEPRSVLRLLDGRVMAVGQAGQGGDQDITVLRLRDDGEHDDMGDDGEQRVDLDNGSDERTLAAVLTADERLVVTGVRGTQMFAARLSPPRYDQLDTTFAAPNGFLTLSAAAGGAAVAIDAAGRIVIAGWTQSPGDVAVARLSANGAPDAGFGAGGVATVLRPGEQRAVGLALQPDGGILVAASTDEAGTGGFLALRLDDAGALDPGFGQAGVAAPPLLAAGAGTGAPVGLALLLDGRFVLAGNAGGAPLLTRFLSDGALDPTFGEAGEQALSLGLGAELTALGLTGDGKLLLAGVRGSFPVQGFVARAFN